MSLPRTATFLDSNSGAPLHPKVAEALLPLLSAVRSGDSESTLFNPSSSHTFGRRARRLMNHARETVSASIGASCPDRIVFTSSGTEANQLAVRSVLEPRIMRGEMVHWITTPVEHDSLRRMVSWAEGQGVEVSLLPVDGAGRPIVQAVHGLWRSSTRLVSCVWANPETGVISDVVSLAEAVAELGGVLHLDAAQAWGKLPIAVEDIGAGLASFSGHKIGAPAGTGLLWASRSVEVQPLISGRQERKMRGGTENLIGILGLGAAAGASDSCAYSAHVAPIRDYLENCVLKKLRGSRVNGAGAPRVANTSSFSFLGVEDDSLVAALDIAGYCVSSGPACSSGSLEPSSTLMAMGLGKEEALGALRVSLHQGTTRGEIDGFVDALVHCIEARAGRRGEF